MSKHKKNQITMKIGFWEGKKKANPKLAVVCDKEILKLKQELCGKTI